MASIVANLPPPLLLHGRKTLFTTLQKVPVSSIRGFSHIAERQTRVTVIVNATGEGSESSTSLSIVKSVQNVWDKSEDRFALIGLGFAAIVAFWASVNVITAIDKLPLIPGVLEFIGILFSSWFIYRYLLFKPDREELFKIVDKSISDVLGQSIILPDNKQY
ncbi:protein CURVATURE THYLAKOID 1C, chloroplastic [Castanea sativa]|uniref:protein CURVATURE THYLAKOID 1C, chloroplastic n=1 Tax=Castanea sativa TaxID=21020 RepID=UPI003F650B5B